MYVSALEPAAFLVALQKCVEPTDGQFEFGARVSGVGVVTQTLRGPETSRQFFGLVGEDGFRIALVVDSSQVTPYEPIIDGEFVPHGRQTALRLKLRPHPHAGMAGGLVTVSSTLLAGLVFVAVGLGWWNDAVEVSKGLALIAGFGALAFVGRVIPAKRAEIGFSKAVERAILALTDALQLSRLTE